MFDTYLNRSIDLVLARTRTHLADLGLTDGPLGILAMAFGIAAAAGVATHLYLWGLALFVFNRGASILLGAQNSVVSIPIRDLIIYAVLAFGFAIADPPRALAASFLLLGIVVLTGCAVAFNASRIVDRSTAIIIGIVIFAAVALCCIRPDWFSLMAYFFGLPCFPFAGTYAASSWARRP